MTTSRDALTSRQIPEMALSDGLNPLTAPLPQSTHGSTTERAAKRFEIVGNAIVTGGAGVLGLEAARALLEHGASGLALFDMNPAQSQQLIDALRSGFPQVKITTKQVDITDAPGVAAAVAETSKEIGDINMLVCFAGVVGTTHAAETELAEWRRILDINTTGSFICAQAVAKHMIQQATGGSIVLIASVSAHRVNFPQPQVAYNVSKGALLQMKSSLAAEWAGYGIRVNSISPGYMNTILNEGDGLSKHRKIWTDRIPMGRMGEPSELTGPIILLCSSAGRYITGTDILADGGISVF